MSIFEASMKERIELYVELAEKEIESTRKLIEEYENSGSADPEVLKSVKTKYKMLVEYMRDNMQGLDKLE